jgi:hypothetical protein
MVNSRVLSRIRYRKCPNAGRHCAALCRFSSLMSALVIMISSSWAAQNSSLPEISERPPQNRSADAGNRSGIESSDSRNELWFLVRVNGVSTGYERTLVVRSPGESGKSTRHRLANSYSDVVFRFRETRTVSGKTGRNPSVHTILESIETVDGLLSQWNLRRLEGVGNRIERSGQWNPETRDFRVLDRLSGAAETVRVLSHDRPRSSLITAWIPFLQLPPDEDLRLPVLLPESSSLIDVKLRRADHESRTDEKSDVAETCRRIDFWPTNQPGLRAAAEFDANGQLVKYVQHAPGALQSVERCSAADALATMDAVTLDRELLNMIPVTLPVSDGVAGSSIRLRIEGGAPCVPDIPNSAYQSVELRSEHSMEVTLTRPALPPEHSTRLFQISSSKPELRYLEANQLVCSEDLGVLRLSRLAGGNSDPAGDQCERLTRFVAGKVRPMAFSSKLIPASDVARSLRCDSTEIAVLLATLMRTRRIPARVAVGLVYSEKTSAFVAHMWVEACIDGSWTPYDAVYGMSDPRAPHLKLRDSSLSDLDVSGPQLFVPVNDLLNRYQFEVIPNEE